MSAPILFSGNQTSKLLQNQIVMANGELLANNGPLNLIKGGGFENGQLNGFSLFNTTLTSGVPTGSISAGATSIDTFAITASSPLGDTYSLSVGSSTGFVAGQGFISPVFNIPNKLLASVLANKFFYSVVSGASNLNFSGTSSNTWAIYWYDVTNSKWVQPAGVYNLVGNSFAPPSTGTVQLDSTCTQARLAVICINNSGGAASMLFDDFSVGPQITSVGPAMSNWGDRPWTPTGTWTSNTTYSGEYRQVGDTAECRVKVSLSGAPNAAALKINLPFTIDTSKMTGTGVYTSPLGYASGNPSTNMQVLYGTSTSVNLVYQSSATSAVQGAVSDTAPTTWASGNEIDIYFTVPIAGWSSNTVQSADTDARVVAFSAYSTSSATSSASAPIVFGSVNFDTHAAFNGTTTWTCPSFGYYKVEAQSYAAGTWDISLYKNGSEVIQAGHGTSAQIANLSHTLKLVAGDTIDIRSQTSISMANTATNSFFNITKVQGPAVVQASSSVSASFALTSATVTTTPATIAIASVNWDSHNARSGNTYIIPLPGEYVASVRYSAGGNAIGFSSNILKGGSTISFPGWNTGSASYNVGHFHEVSFKANAGDVISWQWLTQSSSMTPALQTGDALTIRRVGN